MKKEEKAPKLTPQEQANSRFARHQARLQAARTEVAAVLEKHGVEQFVAPGEPEMTNKGSVLVPLGTLMWRTADRPDLEV